MCVGVCVVCVCVSVCVCGVCVCVCVPWMQRAIITLLFGYGIPVSVVLLKNR